MALGWLWGGTVLRSICRVYAYYMALWWLWVALTANSGLSPNDNQRTWPKRFTTWQVCPEAGDAHHGLAQPTAAHHRRKARRASPSRPPRAPAAAFAVPSPASSGSTARKTPAHGARGPGDKAHESPRSQRTIPVP